MRIAGLGLLGSTIGATAATNLLAIAPEERSYDTQTVTLAVMKQANFFNRPHVHVFIDTESTRYLSKEAIVQELQNPKTYMANFSFGAEVGENTIIE